MLGPKDAGTAVRHGSSKKVEGNENLQKNKKIVANYACFCQTTMLTPKIIKETIENLFQFGLDNDKS